MGVKMLNHKSVDQTIRNSFRFETYFRFEIYPELKAKFRKLKTCR